MDTKKLRQKILDLAIHGKLVPQDPNDEPASVLLERIRAEKEQLIKEGKIKAPKKRESAGDTSHYPKEGPWELPEGWVWTTIGELCTVFSAKRVHQSDWQKVGIPFYRAREIVKLSEHGYVDNDLFISEKLYNEFIGTGLIPGPGDIMISAVGTIGKTYIVRATDRFYFKDASVLCLRNPYLIPAYLDLYLQSTLARTQMHDGSKGTTVDTITIEKASYYLIPIPPSAEQERIVSYLDSILPILVSIESQKACIENLIDKTKQRILDLAIHGKLVSQDPTDEPAIELIKRMNPAFQPSHNLHYAGSIPNGWQIVRMGDLIDIISGTSYQKADIVSADIGVRVLRGGNIQDGNIILHEDDVYINLSLENKNNTIHEGDTVIVASTGSSELIGKAALATKDYRGTQIGAFLRIIRPKSISISEYLGVLFQSEYYKHHIKQVAKGTNINNIKSSYLTEFLIPLPPLEEQRRIIGKIRELFSILDQISNSV